MAPKPEAGSAAQKPDAKKRVAIAAEALTNASDIKIPSIPKSDAILQMFGTPLPLPQGHRSPFIPKSNAILQDFGLSPPPSRKRQ